MNAGVQIVLIVAGMVELLLRFLLAVALLATIIGTLFFIEEGYLEPFAWKLIRGVNA